MLTKPTFMNTIQNNLTNQNDHKEIKICMVIMDGTDGGGMVEEALKLNSFFFQLTYANTDEPPVRHQDGLMEDEFVGMDENRLVGMGVES